MAKKQKQIDRASKFLIWFLILFATLIIVITLYFTTGIINTSSTVFLTNRVETTLYDSEGGSHPIDVTLYFEVDSSKANKYDKNKIQSQLQNDLSNIPYDEFENSDDPVGIIKQSAVNSMLELNPNASKDISGVYVSDIQTGQRQIAGDSESEAQRRQSSVMRGLFKKMN